MNTNQKILIGIVIIILILLIGAYVVSRSNNAVVTPTPSPTSEPTATPTPVPPGGSGTTTGPQITPTPAPTPMPTPVPPQTEAREGLSNWPYYNFHWSVTPIPEAEAAPSINIVKYVNGENANTAPGLYVAVGEPVTWTYMVTNTGNVPLTNVVVTDDQGVTVTTPKTTLELCESMTGTASGTATVGQYTNIGTATDSYGSTTVTASDPANYFGVPP